MNKTYADYISAEKSLTKEEKRKIISRFELDKKKPMLKQSRLFIDKAGRNWKF